MWKVKRERYLSGAGGDPELTPRGVHKVMHLGAITHRGPPHVTPRGLEVRCSSACHCAHWHSDTYPCQFIMLWTNVQISHPTYLSHTATTTTRNTAPIRPSLSPLSWLRIPFHSWMCGF